MIALLAAATICVVGTAPDPQLGPLLCPEKAAKNQPLLDGSALELPENRGPGRAQLGVSLRYLEQRNALLVGVAARLAELSEAMNAVEAGDGLPGPTKDRLLQLSGAPLDEALDILKEAMALEHKRLFLLRKALQAAAAAKAELPGLDPGTVNARWADLENGALAKQAEVFLIAHRTVVQGLVSYLDGDLVSAIRHMKAATTDAPHLPLPHVYLGSLYFVLDQKTLAVAEWRQALELDPTNEAVREALKQHDLK